MLVWHYEANMCAVNVLYRTQSPPHLQKLQDFIHCEHNLGSNCALAKHFRESKRVAHQSNLWEKGPKNNDVVLYPAPDVVFSLACY